MDINFEILPLVSLKHIVVASHESFCKNLVDYFRQAALESNYLEQLWMIALQAKAEGNLQTQVELLKHLSTFEKRLQTISNQTGKSIEVYNPQGKLMTVYHRRQ